MIGCNAERLHVTDIGVGRQGGRIDKACSARIYGGIHSKTTEWNMMIKCPGCKWSLVVLIVPMGDSMGYIFVANVRISDIGVIDKSVADSVRIADIGVDDTRAAKTGAGDTGVFIDDVARITIVAIVTIQVTQIGVVDIAVATVGRVSRSNSGVHSTTTKWNIMNKSSGCKMTLVVLIVPREGFMG